MVTIQNYVRAQSIDEAYELNQKREAVLSEECSGQKCRIA